MIITWKKALFCLFSIIAGSSDKILCIASHSVYNAFKEMAKAELHLHLGGSYPLSFILENADDEQKKKMLECLDKIAHKVDYKDCFEIFGIISKIVNTNEKVQLGTYSLCRELQKDGVTHAEIRTGLKDLGSGFENYLLSVLSGMKKAQASDFKSTLLLSVQRTSSPEAIASTIDLALKYRDWGVVGIDLSGDATVGKIEHLIPELMRAKANGLSLTVHLGEFKNDSDQELIIEKLKPNRIGHGVHLSQKALHWALDNKIPVEVCITSSVLVSMIDNYTNCPWLAYALQGHPIILCTDDPLIFQITLSQEYQKLHNLKLFSKKQLKKIAADSFKYAFK